MENSKLKLPLIKKIEQNLKLQVILCIILCFFVFVVYFIANSIVDKRNSRKYSITNDINLINQIEDIYIEKNKINIMGYAFLLDRSSDDINISLVLRNINSGKEIWTDVTHIPREDVNAYFQSDYNYVDSGFVASVNKKKLYDEYFEIIIKLDYKENSKTISKTVLTNRYLANGKIYSYNPYEIDQQDMIIESKLLNEVFTNGQMCFYQKDIGMYVYHYNNQLYWVANKNFYFEENGFTHVIYHLYTSDVNKLPEQRIQLGFDILDFYFEDYEYIEENTSPYRIAIRDIPNEYPITFITTGVLDTVNDKWLWYKQFQINQNID